MAINSFTQCNTLCLAFHKTQNQATTFCRHHLLQVLSSLDEKCRKLGKVHTNPYVQNAFHCTNLKKMQALSCTLTAYFCAYTFQGFDMMA